MLADLIFPKFCYGCNKSGKYLCAKCFNNRTKLNFFQKCHICKSESRIGFVHEDCKDKSYLDGLVHVVVYDDLVKQLIHDMKYKYLSEICNEFGSIMSEYFKKLYNLKDFVVTAIPLHRSKYYLRGFNQAEKMAKRFCAELNYEYLEIIERKSKTKTQVGMNQIQRESNLKDAFEIIYTSEIANKLLNYKKIILIDDVFTTGTTMNEVARIIKSEYEHLEVFGFSFARA
jgi:competence protein ComFC